MVLCIGRQDLHPKARIREDLSIRALRASRPTDETPSLPLLHKGGHPVPRAKRSHLRDARDSSTSHAQMPKARAANACPQVRYAFWYPPSTLRRRPG